jgi:hypothetical protein
MRLVALPVSSFLATRVSATQFYLLCGTFTAVESEAVASLRCLLIGLEVLFHQRMVANALFVRVILVGRVD